MEIVKDFKNDLLERREIITKLESHENPGFEGAKKAIIEEFKVDESLIVIKKVGGSFGSNEFLIEVFIYDSVERKEKVEPKKKEKKK